ncbi:MAG: Holliday junction branch migration protein RuvA [Treponema sp.]|jgi:Holliday junction DNA helicase RuvA|nr:Holliday junction branch migration protein RuvA [Treponema sp.]
MFNSLQGIISEKQGDTVRLITHGIEWDIAVPVIDAELLAPVGQEARIFVWLYHKEDMLRLFGFADESRRETFLALLKVEGIGPRGALKIMGGISQKELEQALEHEDISRLEAVPGLGKKTAQKMILSLKGKLVSAQSTHVLNHPYPELFEALITMGYDRKSVEETLKAVAKQPDTEEALFKRAIVALSTRQ